MNIGFVTTSFPRFEGDIAGHFVLGMAKALADRGHHIEVLAPEPHEGTEPPHWNQIDVTWVPYVRPRKLAQTFYGAGVPDNIERNPFSALGILAWAANARRLLRRRRHRWDAVISHWSMPSAFIAGSVFFGKRPHLGVCHSADIYALERLKRFSWFPEKIAATANSLMFVSPSLQHRFERLLAPSLRGALCDKAWISPMGIEPPIESAVSRESLRQRLGFHQFTILSLGRLIPIKNITLAMDALAGCQGVELIIAGDGPQRDELVSYARFRRCPVRFLGVVKGAQKADIMRASDAFIFTSRDEPNGRTEGMPTTILEAMSYGLPIISSDVSDIKAMTHNGKAGYVLPSNGAAEFTKAITALQKSPDHRAALGAFGAQAASAFNWPSRIVEIERRLIECAESLPEASS